VRERLAGLHEPERRLAILERLVEDAAAQLQEANLVVQVNETDRALLGEEPLDRLLAGLGEGQALDALAVGPEPAPILGGAVVRPTHGRRMVDNSWDERLRLARDVLRDEVYQRLSGSDGARSAR
jgi:vacuolar-type H+-ATPase subunit E/Vma4